MKRILSVLAIASLVLVMAACGSSQDRRDGFYEKAQKLVAEGKLSDAEIELKNAIKIDPKFAKAYALLAKAYLQEHNWAGAFANYQRAAELNPDDIESHVGLCKLFLLSRDLKKAEERADLVLAKDPANVDAGVIKAIALTKQGRGADALAMLERMQQANPNSPDIFIAQAETHQALKDPDAAEAALLKGLEKNPRHTLILLQLATLYAEQKRTEEAEKRYQDIVAADPAKASANMLLVNFYYQSGQQDKATQALANLASRNPKEPSYRIAQGQSALSAGKTAEAEAILTQALRDIPDSRELRVAMAEFYQRTGQFAKIEPLVADSIQKEPDHPQSVVMRRILASALLASGQPDKAKPQLDALFKRNPRDLEGHLLSGTMKLQARQYREAVQELREVVDADPKNIRAVELLARAHVMNQEGPLAEALLTRFVNDNPKSLQARMLLVESLLAGGKADRAVSELSALAGPDQTNPAVFITLGDLQAQRQNLAAARAAYKRATEVAPKEPVGFVRMARTLALGKDLKGAGAALDQALALAPNSAEALEAKVGVLLLEKRAAEAKALVQARLAAQPDSVFVQTLLGRVLMDSGDLAGAEAELNKAAQLAKDNPAPYQLLGSLYMRQGKLDQGVAKYREAYDANPANTGAGMALAILLETNGKRAEAAQVYEKLLAKNPDNVPAVNNLAYLYADNPSASPEDIQKAQVLAEKLKSVDAPTTYDTVGWVQHKIGNREEALKYLLRAWDKGGNSPTIAYHLGVVYLAKGDNASAAKWLEKAVAAKGNFPEKAQAQAELAKARGKK